MNHAEQQLVMNHLQHMAMYYQALRVDLPKLLEILRYSIGEQAPSADDITTFLRKDSTQRELESHWETACYMSADHRQTWRLISLAFRPEKDVCQRRLNKRPPSQDSCNFCFIEEKGFDREMMVAELDTTNNPLGPILHRCCMPAWRRIRDTAERST